MSPCGPRHAATREKGKRGKRGKGKGEKGRGEEGTILPNGILTVRIHCSARIGLPTPCLCKPADLQTRGMVLLPFGAVGSRHSYAGLRFPRLTHLSRLGRLGRFPCLSRSRGQPSLPRAFPAGGD